MKKKPVLKFRNLFYRNEILVRDATSSSGAGAIRCLSTSQGSAPDGLSKANRRIVSEPEGRIVLAPAEWQS